MCCLKFLSDSRFCVSCEMHAQSQINCLGHTDTIIMSWYWEDSNIWWQMQVLDCLQGPFKLLSHPSIYKFWCKVSWLNKVMVNQGNVLCKHPVVRLSASLTLNLYVKFQLFLSLDSTVHIQEMVESLCQLVRCVIGRKNNIHLMNQIYQWLHLHVVLFVKRKWYSIQCVTLINLFTTQMYQF